MLVVYVSDSEVLVCTPDNEMETLKQYFTDTGRDLDDYDRHEEHDVAVKVEARLHSFQCLSKKSG